MATLEKNRTIREVIGDSTYVGIHQKIGKLFGKATICENCHTSNAKRYEWANLTGVYSLDRKNWKRLCTSCHRVNDKGSLCKRGHEFTPENFYRRKDRPIGRICRKCNTLRGLKLYYAKNK